MFDIEIRAAVKVDVVCTLKELREESYNIEPGHLVYICGYLKKNDGFRGFYRIQPGGFVSNSELDGASMLETKRGDIACLQKDSELEIVRILP